MPDARDIVTRAFPFNRVTHKTELGDLTPGTVLEREMASQARIQDASHYYDPEFAPPTFDSTQTPVKDSTLQIIEETPFLKPGQRFADETSQDLAQVCLSKYKVLT